MNLLTSAYGYHLHDVLEGVYLPNGLLQYQNSWGFNARGLSSKSTAVQRTGWK